jgi:hypothetical protein
MPLDDLQKSVLAILLRTRTPGSVFAGGSVLNRHAFRLSDDQDIFHAEDLDVAAVAEKDVGLLEGAGYSVELSKKYEGFIEAYVGAEDQGRTKIQWVEAGSWSFFSPVPDPEYGYRLHIVDLSVNKVLAAGGRREVRDFVDLALIHCYVMPLWQAIWAAPGKDQNWSPMSLLERISRQNNFHQEDIDEAIDSLVELSALEIGTIIREALDDARDIFPNLIDETAGCLLLDREGHLVTDYTSTDTSDIQIVQPRRGGAWPSSPSIDHLLIDGLIERFGRDGARLLEADDDAVFEKKPSTTLDPGL